MNVATDGDGSGDRLDIGLLQQQFTNIVTQLLHTCIDNNNNIQYR